MSNFDDLFNTQPKDGFGNEPFDVDAWAAKKQAERQDAYNTAEAAALEISTDGDKFKSYLDVKARFIQHSATNALIIYAVSPQATEIRDFNGWKDLGASIKRDQKAIPILEPGDTYTREDGSIGTSWNVRKVFDISQTTARPRHRPPQRYDDRTLLTAMISKSPVPVSGVDELPDNMGAYYDHEQQVITQHIGMGLDGRKHLRNLNTIVVGGSGAGKTRFYAKPNLCQANTSFVVLDPKGELLRDTGHLLEHEGYEVRVLDLLNMEKSHEALKDTVANHEKEVLKQNDKDTQEPAQAG